MWTLSEYMMQPGIRQLGVLNLFGADLVIRSADGTETFIRNATLVWSPEL